MRILIVTNRIPYPLHDGGNMAMHAMIQGYRATGHEVQVLAMHTTRHPVDIEAVRKAYSGITVQTVTVDNRVKLLPLIGNLLFSRQPNHAMRFRNKAFAQALKDILLHYNPQVVQLESIYLNSYTPLIRQHSKAVLVQRLHNVEYEIWQRLAREMGNPAKKLYLSNLAKRIRHYERQAWRDADLLLPITADDGKVVIQERVRTPQCIAPFGIDTAQMPAPSAHPQWAGYHIGAMDWLPNAEAMKWFLQEVWPVVHSANPDFQFSFAGRQMPDYFKTWQLPNVTCAGEVADAQAFVGDKQILLVPLRSGGGIRVKILEAMAAGKTIISTATGMQGIVADDRTHFLLADTPKAFADAVARCLAHPAEALEMSRQARALVQSQYDRDTIARTVAAQLEGMVSPDPQLS